MTLPPNVLQTNPSPLTRLRARRRWFVAILAAYFVISVAGVRPYPGRAEFFPCFFWGLFCLVPGSEAKEFSLYVESEDVTGWFESLGGELAKARSIEAHRVIQRLGKAITESDMSTARVNEVSLKRLYLTDLDPPATLTVFLRTYDPLERYEHGTSEEVAIYRFQLVEARTLSREAGVDE